MTQAPSHLFLNHKALILWDQRFIDAEFKKSFLENEDFLYSLSSTFGHFESFINSPDVLLFNEETKFSSQSILEIIKFESRKPMILKKKFCIFANSEMLAPIHQNKLLKVLEDGHSYLYFLFLSSRPTSLIQTLRSRTITRKLNEVFQIKFEKKQDDQVSKLFNISGFQEFNTFYKKIKNEKVIWKYFVDFIIQVRTSSPVLLNKIYNLSKWLEESKLYNNPASERAFFLYKTYNAIQSSKK